MDTLTTEKARYFRICQSPQVPDFTGFLPDPCNKVHAKRDVVLLDEIEQPLPDAPLRPTNEELRRQPPRTQFGGDAAPLRAVLVSPENRRDRPSQLLGRRLSARPHRLDQRLPNRPS